MKSFKLIFLTNPPNRHKSTEDYWCCQRKTGVTHDRRFGRKSTVLWIETSVFFGLYHTSPRANIRVECSCTSNHQLLWPQKVNTPFIILRRCLGAVPLAQVTASSPKTASPHCIHSKPHMLYHAHRTTHTHSSYPIMLGHGSLCSFLANFEQPSAVSHICSCSSAQ